MGGGSVAVSSGLTRGATPMSPAIAPVDRISGYCSDCSDCAVGGKRVHLVCRHCASFSSFLGRVPQYAHLAIALSGTVIQHSRFGSRPRAKVWSNNQQLRLASAFSQQAVLVWALWWIESCSLSYPACYFRERKRRKQTRKKEACYINADMPDRSGRRRPMVAKSSGKTFFAHSRQPSSQSIQSYR